MVVLTKGPIKTTASYLAQGGVAAAVGSDDDPALHAEDTIAVGRGLSRPSAVSVLTSEAPARVADLTDLGVEFDPGLGLEGGHSRARVVHAAARRRARQIAHTLAERVLAIRGSGPAGAGARALVDRLRCVGVIADGGAIKSRATLLATGGGGRALGTNDQPRGRGRRRDRHGLPRRSRRRRPRVHPVPSDCSARFGRSPQRSPARRRRAPARRQRPPLHRRARSARRGRA